MRTRRLLLSLVVLVCSSLSLSCSSNAGGDAAPPQGETPPLPQGPGPSLSAPPGTTVSAGGRSVDMGTGTYCWTRMCVDKIGPITRARLDVQRGTRLVVAIPAGPPPLREASVSAFPAGASQAVGNGETAWQPDFDRATELAATRTGANLEVTADLPPGSYVLVVGMFFNPGDVQYAVVLDVR